MNEMICPYCGFIITNKTITRIKGIPYHTICIKVKRWNEKKKEELKNAYGN